MLADASGFRALLSFVMIPDSAFWKTALTFFGGSAALVATLVAAGAWLLRTLFAHVLSKDIEGYKSRLSSESAKDIESFKSRLSSETERFKTDLQRVLKEHEVRFSNLQAKRVEVLARLHMMLSDLRAEIDFLSLFIEQPGGNGDAMAKANLDSTHRRSLRAYRYFRRNMLYLDSSIADQVQTLWANLNGVVVDQVLIPTDASAEEVTVMRQKFIRDWKEKQSDISTASSLIEKEFRAMLGSEEAKLAASAGQ